MQIGKPYQIQVPSKQHKKGYTTSIVCLRKCDECGQEKIIRYQALKRQRENRGRDIDVCNKCCNKRGYRNMPKGEAWGNFKHGLTSNGYKRLTLDDGTRMLEHRYIMEIKIGRSLTVDEEIHHIDGDKTNNHENNLFLCSKKTHAGLHSSVRRLGFSLYRDLIWFDFEKNIYTLDFIKPLCTELYIDFHPKLYVKKNPRIQNGGTYQFYSVKQNGKFDWRRWHVYVAEKKMKRKLRRNESVHHIDGNGLNNHHDNLQVMTKKRHSKCHASLESLVFQMYRKKMVCFETQKVM